MPRYRSNKRYGNQPRHESDLANSWSTTTIKKPRPPPPPGLKGREIGLYYKSLQRETKSSQIHKINLRIPKGVITKLVNNLKLICKIAENENIFICPKKNSILFKNEVDQQNKKTSINIDNEMSEPSLKQAKMEKSPKLESADNYGITTETSKPIKTENHIGHPKPGPSACDDFIPIKSDLDDYSGLSDRLLSLRGPSNYKYSYNDIITGSFNEKLDECLTKGINVTKFNTEIAKLNINFYEEFNNTLQKVQYQKMKVFRETLPTYKKREELLNVINNNQVVVISGETGCGKSTQVPQLILDDALMKKQGANVKILITQPRRIAASSLAARVASERAETMGNSVGYAVRLEKIEARARGSMMFCTTGVLLVDLEINQGLTDYSHVILDEVHERDCHIDFAMCMLKQILEKRKDLKLILMSATLDADKLSAYFNDCPMMHIEGLAYPVKDIYLEEILHLTKFQLPAEKEDNPIPQFKPYMRHVRKFKILSQRIEKKAKYLEEVDPWLRTIKKTVSPSVFETLQNSKIEELNLDLVFEVVKYICRGPPGAILIFLPGIGEITNLLKLIAQNQSCLGSKCEVYPLHSKLPTIDQRKIFDKSPDHVRKIIVATNIAETSITIDDIVYVIDGAKVKYRGLNVEQYLSTLKVEWEAQANLRQRRGRAGRCQPGVCYHLVTSYRASKLEERLRPELQRSDLLEPVLTIKRLRLGKVADALKNVPDPPADTTIERAVTHLQQCGALDDQERLTPLGWHLARLPLHPAAGKLVVLGALFGCLDRAASVAAVWSFKDPFIIVIDKEDQVKAAKRKLALGEPSDQIAMSEAILQWERCAPHRRRDFSYTNFLSSHTIELLSDMKKQIGSNLAQMGFLNSSSLTSKWENRNSDNLSLFKAIVAAALYPNIATAGWTNMRSSNPNKQVRVKVRTLEGAVTIHPSSLMIPPKGNNRRGKQSVPVVRLCDNPGANWCVYWLKQKSSDIFLIDVTLVYTLPLLFFGELKVSECQDEPDQCYVSILEYKVQILKGTAELLLELRSLLDQVLASKIMASSNHSTKHSQFEENVLNAVIEVLTAEDERAEYLEDASESDNSECDVQY